MRKNLRSNIFDVDRTNINRRLEILFKLYEENENEFNVIENESTILDFIDTLKKIIQKNELSVELSKQIDEKLSKLSISQILSLICIIDICNKIHMGKNFNYNTIIAFDNLDDFYDTDVIKVLKG